MTDRRIHLELLSPAELAIKEAMREVEKLPADRNLSIGLTFLEWAFKRVADFVDEHGA